MLNTPHILTLQKLQNFVISEQTFLHLQTRISLKPEKFNSAAQELYCIGEAHSIAAWKILFQTAIFLHLSKKNYPFAPQYCSLIPQNQFFLLFDWFFIRLFLAFGDYFTAIPKHFAAIFPTRLRCKIRTYLFESIVKYFEQTRQNFMRFRYAPPKGI